MPFHPNIPYYAPSTADDYQRERCMLDLSLPDRASNFPLIVWFHGGGLEEGCKDGDVTIALASRGVGMVIPSYRLYPRAHFPDPVDDAAACVAWAIRNATSYGADPHSVFIAGHSAGGYLAAIVATDPSYLARYGVKLSDIAGVIPVSGQMFTHATIRKERGVNDPWNTPTIDDAAPAFHAGKHVPPILAICGSEDIPARPEENSYFVALLKSVGHEDATYLEVAGRDHGSIVATIADPGDATGEALLAFVAAHRR
ncbi:MAG TPA: alpha/beta hydrolase [Capsulimonadaceae bacterium]|jgi:acetyl esterase/lipase